MEGVANCSKNMDMEANCSKNMVFAYYSTAARACSKNKNMEAN